MKKIIFITSVFIILAVCGLKFKAILSTTFMDNGQDQNGILNYDASLASNKKTKDPGKHSSCRHYHKKKYE